MLIDSIQHSTSTIRTGFGESERTYSSDPDDPFHGTGQGSGTSPAACFVITIVLIEALLDARVGTFITLAILLQLLRFPATLFVDDTDFLITGSTDNEDSTSILLESQLSVLLWSALLHATGGSLQPDKCRWALIDFCWVAGEPKYKSITESPGIMAVHNTNRTLENIR